MNQSFFHSFQKLSISPFREEQAPQVRHDELHALSRILKGAFGDKASDEKVQEIARNLAAINESFATKSAPEVVRQIHALDFEEPFASTRAKAINFLAWLQLRAISQFIFMPLAKKRVEVLIALDQFETGWLADYLPIDLPLWLTDRSIESIGNPAIRRTYDLLQSVQRGDLPITVAQKAALAIFTACMPNTKRYFKRDCFGLATSLHGDPDHKAFYLLLKNKVNLPCDPSSCKKVTVGLSLPVDDTVSAEWVVEATNREEEDDAVQAMEEEANIQKQFSDSPGIWPVLSVCRHVKIENGQPKISIIMPLAEGSFSTFVKHFKKLPFTTQLDSIIQLTQGLARMHCKLLIHGDIKVANILFKIIDNRSIQVGFTDFGFSFFVGQSMSQIFKDGYYGSMYCTPPELFGEVQFSGNLYKAEMWAFGYVLFECVFDRRPPWEPIGKKYQDLYVDTDSETVCIVSSADREEMKKRIDQEIEQPRVLLLQQKTLSHFETLQLFVYDLMRYDPALRLDAATALQRLLLI